MRFGYLRDPLFLVCVAAYFLNRFVFKAVWQTGFVHEHLNDLICIPFWVPIMLFAQRKLRLRRCPDWRLEASRFRITILSFCWCAELPACDRSGNISNCSRFCR